MATIYAVDFAEVRLPLTETQLSFLDIPEIYRGQQPDFRDGPNVTLTSQVADLTHEWRARIVRSEGTLDVRTRQLFVIAQVKDPYGFTEDGRPPLKVGTFVQAKIRGAVLQDVFVVPRRLLRENSFLLTVDSENLLRRKTVNIIWQNDRSIVVNEGLVASDRLCLTDVPFALEALPVEPTELDDLPFEVEKVDVQEIISLRPPPARSGGGGFLGQMLSSIPADKTLPPDLKAKLDSITSGGDRSQIRTVMQELSAWANSQGIELSSGGDRGGG